MNIAWPPWEQMVLWYYGFGLLYSASRVSRIFIKHDEDCSQARAQESLKAHVGMFPKEAYYAILIIFCLINGWIWPYNMTRYILLKLGFIKDPFANV